ncbi:glycosyl transferase family protein [Gayadomonas joobiniege]|uniref:glycosyl transferase family protein n=1 Tax=Gayadomonas joobiniege TaxID=1234606 RepID=UPI00035D818B|nr:glycosyl transferase family protein [Gayadomonas joobiniege]
MSSEFKEYIKLIGKGQNAGKTLDQAQAEDAMLQVFNDQVTAEQLGAFLMLLRVREETPEELAGFIKAARACISDEYKDLPVDLDLGCYAGKRRHLPWLLLAVKAYADSGKKVFIHGTAEPESKRLYMREVFAHFGIQPATNRVQAQGQLDKHGVCYAELSSVHPALDKLIQLRSVFALRSCANTLARMLNPSRARLSLHGVHHRHFDERHAEVAKICDENNVMCFRGEGGEIEVNPERAVKLHFYAAGVRKSVQLPAFLDNWQIKPRALELDELKALWCKQIDNAYGEAAVQATLTVFLIMEQLETLAKAKTEQQEEKIIQQCREQASQLWQNRNSQYWF